jgi:hypothetical protein
MSESGLPAWVQWLAQDADGTWWGYEVEPLQRDHGWYENEVGRHVRLHQEAANAYWARTLRRIRDPAS